MDDGRCDYCTLTYVVGPEQCNLTTKSGVRMTGRVGRWGTEDGGRGTEDGGREISGGGRFRTVQCLALARARSLVTTRSVSNTITVSAQLLNWC